ncbi:Protein of unknown function [Bacillus toyonensis]|nr:Protein of unknown function [Bacillus toyonensis]
MSRSYKFEKKETE